MTKIPRAYLTGLISAGSDPYPSLAAQQRMGQTWHEIRVSGPPIRAVKKSLNGPKG
jgi:hypothetical protein